MLLLVSRGEDLYVFVDMKLLEELMAIARLSSCFGHLEYISARLDS